MYSSKYTRRSFLCLLSASVLWYLSGVEELRAANLVAERIYESLMRSHPRYPRYSLPKALAGCFDWQKSTPDEPSVRFLAVVSPGRGRRGASIGRLASRALDRCQRAQLREEAPCECQVIDRNGKNVLEPPEDFVRREKGGLIESEPARRK